MKPAGFLCRIDKLGRIVIPKPLRQKYDIQIDDTLELFTENDAIIVKKYAMSCIFCGSDDELETYMGKTVCRHCRENLSKH